MVVIRTTFLIDGFNLYHSLIEAQVALGGRGTRWLDLRALCRSFLSNVSVEARLTEVVYFSALARHREAFDPAVVLRHRAYLDCLSSTGVRIELGRFKEKRGACRRCHEPIIRHEEKETDVALGIEILDQFWMDRCDTLVLVTGDSDLSPALRLARRRHPQRSVFCAFPYGRIGFELRALATGSFRIRAERYALHQLPDPVELPDGRKVRKPTGW